MIIDKKWFELKLNMIRREKIQRRRLKKSIKREKIVNIIIADVKTTPT
jgi:hypothetical protein